MTIKIWVAGEKVTADDLNANFNLIPAAPSSVTTYTATANSGDNTTQFDITNPAGTTFRYTYDGNGTDPGISAASMPVGTIVQILSPNFNDANNGTFVVTGSGTNYFEVTNASGVAQSNKTIGTGGYFNRTNQTWTKPAGLVKIMVELVGGGASGGSNAAQGGRGGSSYFGSHCHATGGEPGLQAISGATPGGVGGIGVGGDLNIAGGDGGKQPPVPASGNYPGGIGGNSYFGGIGPDNGKQYGGGGAGSDGTVGGNNATGGGGGGGYTRKLISAASLGSTERIAVGVGCTLSGFDGANGCVVITEWIK